MNNDQEAESNTELEKLAAKLPGAVQPERDLWLGIEEAILQPSQHPQSVWNTVWARAAVVVLLVGGSSGLTYLAVTGNPPTVGPVVIQTDYLFETVSGDFGTKFTLGNDYLEARDQLEDGLEEKVNALAPEARTSVITNLNTIRLAIKEINAALAKEPDSELLHELLLSTYHEEMSLMIKVDGIANSVMRRDDI